MTRDGQGRTLGFAGCVVVLTGLLVSSAAAQTLVVPGFKSITVLVDSDHCNQTSSLCLDSGSVGPAANGNDSIVAVYVHVPTAGLAETAFSLTSVTNAGLGVTPAFVSSAACAACFAEPEPGVYRLAARPSSGAWGGGTYVVLLSVTKPSGVIVSVVVPIDVPF